MAYVTGRSSVPTPFARATARLRRSRTVPILSEQAVVEQVCRHMEQKLEHRIEIRALALSLGYTEFQLIRAFRRCKDATPYEHLVHLRMERARQLLSAGLPIVETSLATGFSDQSHFTRFFKRHFGVTPRRYLVLCASRLDLPSLRRRGGPPLHIDRLVNAC